MIKKLTIILSTLLSGLIFSASLEEKHTGLINEIKVTSKTLWKLEKIHPTRNLNKKILKYSNELYDTNFSTSISDYDETARELKNIFKEEDIKLLKEIGISYEVSPEMNKILKMKNIIINDLISVNIMRKNIKNNLELVESQAEDLFDLLNNSGNYGAKMILNFLQSLEQVNIGITQNLFNIFNNKYIIPDLLKSAIEVNYFIQDSNASNAQKKKSLKILKSIQKILNTIQKLPSERKNYSNELSPQLVHHF